MVGRTPANRHARHRAERGPADLAVPWAALALVLALAAPARAEEARGPELELDRLVLEEGLEGFWGYYTRDVASLMASGRIRVVPRVTWGDWRLTLDGDVRHRSPFVSSDDQGLPQVEGEGKASLRFRPTRRFRVTLEGELGGRDRSSWPDQYQPTATGDLLPTDRYSSWWRGGGLRIGAIPVLHHHLRVSYAYALVEYRLDPNYEPIERPTHLVPRSHDEHGGELAWHRLRDGLRVGGGVDWFYRHYFYAFARDAGTGVTHAAAGGTPANPLERLWGLDPTVDVEIDLADGGVTLELAYTHRVVVDPYRGYRSLQGPYPKAGISWRPNDALELSVKASYRRYLYFQGGYAASANHPALDSGSQRFDQRLMGTVVLEHALRAHLYLVAEFRCMWRTTNFPDYVPGVYPATRAYDIDWDYTNYRGYLGLRYQL